MFHCLLIDTKMPGMNGFELLAEIRKLELELKVPKQFAIALEEDFTEQSE